MLRVRLQHLEQEYNELVDYTKKEVEILTLADNKVLKSLLHIL